MNRQIKKDFIDSYSLHWSDLVAYAYYRTSDYHLAEDLAQQAFLKTWEYLKSEKNVDDLKKFLFTVTRNLIIDYYRKKDRQPEISEPAKMSEIADKKTSFLDKDIINQSLFEKYLSGLSEHYRRILEYRYLKKMEIEEISHLTGRSRNHVSVMIYRASKIIKKKFGRV